MKILGIDPGTERLGYAILSLEDAHENSVKLVTCGIIQTKNSSSDDLRLAEIRKDLNFIIEEHKPSVMSVEKLFFFKNLKTVIPVAQARGVILELAGTHKIDCYEYTPLQVKQIITGQGRAEKSLLNTFVKKEFNLTEDIKPDDAVDAIAIALSYLRTDHIKNLAPSS